MLLKKFYWITLVELIPERRIDYAELQYHVLDGCASCDKTLVAFRDATNRIDQK